MRVAVVGVGAIGGPIAASLAENKINIIAVTKHADLAETIRTEGIILQGKEKVRSVLINAVPLIRDIKEKIDIVFLAMKTTSVIEAAKEIVPLLHENSVVVTLQNGIVEDEVGEIVGRERVIGAVVAWGSTMVKRGVIKRTGNGVFFIGLIDDNGNQERLKEVAELLGYCQPVIITDNIYNALHTKLGINAAINGLSAISGFTIAELADNARAIRLYMYIATEMMKIADKLEIQLISMGSPVHPRDIVITDSDTLVTIENKEKIIQKALATYKNAKPSTLQSLERGQRSEIDYLNGYIVKKGKELSIPTPVNSLITQMVKEIESGKRKISPNNLLEFSLP